MFHGRWEVEEKNDLEDIPHTETELSWVTVDLRDAERAEPKTILFCL